MKRKMTLWSMALIVGLFFLKPIAAQTFEKQFNLNELVNIALKNNPHLKVNDKNIEAGLKQIDYLDKNYLPQMFFDLNLSRWDWVMPNKQKYLDNSLNDFYSAFRITQLIYDWNKNSLQKDYAYKSVDIDRNYGRKLRQALSFSLSKTYLELLKAKRTVNIQEEAIAQLREHLKNAEALYSIGKVSNLDVIKAKVQIEVALDELTKSKNQLDVQRNNLNVLCGNTLSDSFDVVDKVDEWWKEYYSKSYSVNELKSILAKQHPDLENINTQKELRNKEIQLYNKPKSVDRNKFLMTVIRDDTL